VPLGGCGRYLLKKNMTDPLLDEVGEVEERNSLIKIRVEMG
jgi:hypothetical protein